jgi:hypothetical protein
MTSTTDIITASCAILGALGVIGGGFIFATHFSNRLAFAERDSEKALSATEAHAVQLALTKDHAETALALGEKHTQALSDTGARVAGMESTFQDIRGKLAQLDGIREDIGELKVSVATLTEQGQNTRNDVQQLARTVKPRLTGTKKRKR